MKNASLSAIYTALTAYNYDNAEVMAELYNEIHRNDGAKSAKDALYNEARGVVLETIRVANAPVTLSEIYESCVGNLPQGFTKGMVQYGLAHQWVGDVTKVSGKVNTYTIAS